MDVSLRSDRQQTLLVHQFSCRRDLSDEEGVGKPNDVGSQSDSRNLEVKADTIRR